jgi:hypothetical protein
MPLDSATILPQIGYVLTRFSISCEGPGGLNSLTTLQLEELFAVIVHALDCCAPRGSIFDKRKKEIVNEEASALSYKVEVLAGVLTGLRGAYEAGLLRSVEEMVRAEMFDDFVEMAAYLHGAGFKDSAAVLVGGVLEEHLRKLCLKHGIPITTTKASGDEPKKAGVMNDDLARADVYSKLDQKNVTAWLDLRNKAAHGRYDEYDAQHVDYMIAGVKGFLPRYPA